jgi:GT2 family glycosyltransferase
MKDLSISIVAFNDEEDVLKAVESVEGHTPSFVSKTIYVIDNGGKSENFKNALEKWPDVKYVAMPKNVGFGAGHNEVLCELDSKFHAFVNPDIELTEDAFTPLLKFMEEDGAGMAVPRILDKEGNLTPVYRLNPTAFDMFIRMFIKGGFKKRRAKHTMQDMDYTKPFDVPFAQGSFLVIKTDLLKELGGFDERFFLYMEDADLCRRVNRVSKLRYCPYASVIHRWEKGSHKSLKLFALHVSSMLKYFKKWKNVV